MANQCRNCGRDVNNNYTSYTNAYASSNHTKKGNGSTTSAIASSPTTATSAHITSSMAASTQITAKVMFGTVGAIKELREKEQAEKNSATRAGRRQP